MKKVLGLSLVMALLASLFSVAASDPAAYTETTGFLDAGDHRIPYTMLIPNGACAFPAIVMCHGYASNRNEAGGGYALFAPKLAEAGIASIRFDVIGCGESETDYLAFTLQTAIDDAIKCLDFIAGQPGVDENRVGIMGWSMGGGVALMAAGSDARFKSVLTWAGSYFGGAINEREYAIALRDGFYEATFDWRDPLKQSPQMYEVQKKLRISELFPKSAAPVCAINGTLDDRVAPATAKRIVSLSQHAASKVELLENADHTFNIFSGDMTMFETLMGISIEWFEETL